MKKFICVIMLCSTTAFAQTDPADEATIIAAGDACLQHYNKIRSQGQWMPGWENCDVIIPTYNNIKINLANEAKQKIEQDKLDLVNSIAAQVEGK